MKPLKLGQRVRVKSLNAKGEVFHIDNANYYAHHMLPIQILLDKPLEDDSYQMKGANWYRTDVKDIVRLKKKVVEEPVKPKKKKKKKKSEELIFDFT